MNRAITYILFFLIVVACDNSSNVGPDTNSYFLKFYGQTGFQEGVDVKETADGGFIIAGNSISTFQGQSDYLLIKVDASGNQQWQQTYDLGGDDRMTEVVIANNNYVFAGTSNINGFDKIVLKMVDGNGGDIGYFELEMDSLYNYTCTGLTYSQSNNYLVVGSLDSPVGVSINGNSILGIVSSDFSTNNVKYSGIDVEKLTFIKAYEVTNSLTQVSNYLAFGYKQNSTTGDIEMGVAQYDNLLEPIDLSQYKNASNAQTVDVIPTASGQFILLGVADTLSVIMQADKNASENYFVSGGNEISTGILGNGLADINGSDIVISGNIQIQNSDITKASIFYSNLNGNIKWAKEFGSASTYKAGKVRVLTDGSIVFTGTSELESQAKAFLVKMKSNGEMN